MREARQVIVLSNTSRCLLLTILVEATSQTNRWSFSPVESSHRLSGDLFGSTEGPVKSADDTWKPIGDHLRLKEAPFRQLGGPAVPKRPSHTDTHNHIHTDLRLIEGPFGPTEISFRPTVDPVTLSKAHSVRKRPFRRTRLK